MFLTWVTGVYRSDDDGSRTADTASYAVAAMCVVAYFLVRSLGGSTAVAALGLAYFAGLWGAVFALFHLRKRTRELRSMSQ